MTPMFSSQTNAIVTCIVLFALFKCSSASQYPYLAVDWNENKYYGPDGPWQAVTVGVGGVQNDTPIANQQVKVDLMPGGIYSSFIPTTDSCSTLSSAISEYCAIGGSWSPESYSDIGFQPSLIIDAAGIDAEDGTIYSQAATLYTSQGSQTAYGVSLGVFDAAATAKITYPNNVVTGFEVGFLALDTGADHDQYQVFSTPDSTHNATYAPIRAWIYAGYMYNMSIIPSYSYGLHIGSAALGYVGSLYFGGFDTNRVIGPVLSFNVNITLQDISIGVETGDNPFSVDPQAGLLQVSTGTQQSIVVEPDPQVPYLYLPGDTCEAIAALLPVYFDQSTKYYLWNTTDPDYEKIIRSPAYLGFTFPSSSDSNGTMIKVPFWLLNLTLTDPVVAKPVQYFPCQPYSPQDGDIYRLGRAFLQAAFIGRNTNTYISWLAQAPGPGSSTPPNGLGTPTGVTIKDTDTSLSGVNSDSSLFNRSWADTWTPLTSVTSDPNITANGTSHNGTAQDGTSDKAKTGISGGAIAGIAIGAVAGTSIIGAAAWFCLRKSRTEKVPLEMSAQPMVTESKEPSETSSAVPLNPLNKPNAPKPITAFHNGPQAPPQYGVYNEMPGWQEPHELAVQTPR